MVERRYDGNLFYIISRGTIGRGTTRVEKNGKVTTERKREGSLLYEISGGFVGKGSTTHVEDDVEVTIGRKRHSYWVRKVTSDQSGFIKKDDYRLFDGNCGDLLFADRWTPGGRAIVDLMRRNSESA